MKLSSKYRPAKNNEPAYLPKSDDKPSYLLTQEEVDIYISTLKKSLEIDDELMEFYGINEFRHKLDDKDIDMNNFTDKELIRADLTNEETKRLKDYLKQSIRMNDKLFVKQPTVSEIGSRISKVGQIADRVNELYNFAQFDLLREELLNLKNTDTDTSERYEKNL